jgi:hypothetical protein
MFMLNQRPQKRRAKPAVAKALAQEQRREDQLRLLDGILPVLYGVLVGTMAWHLTGSSARLGRVAQVGDQLTFSAALASPILPADAEIAARHVAGPWAPPGGNCLLDVPAMQHGGAMTVMALRPDGVMLSWAGGATAAGSSACHGGDDVLVSNANYEQLAADVAPVSPVNPR